MQYCEFMDFLIVMTKFYPKLNLCQNYCITVNTKVRILSTFQYLSNAETSKKKSSKYRHTIFEPSSPFFRTVEGRKRSKHEDQMRQLFNTSDAYDLQFHASNGKEFILHDGPPYANGKPHLGHAFNKILKDVVVRYKFLKGYKVNFQPGWDCHGLPIELKALEKAKKKKETYGNWDNLSHLQIRSKASELANETIQIQKETFDKWGLFLNWKNCYTTSNSSYVSREIDLFYKLYNDGMIFQDFLPVHFSPSSKSSLAEAELEYNENHESPSLYLALPVVNQLHSSLHLSTSLKLHLCIWTTTPWSLPSNAAVCINPLKEYLIVETFVNEKKIALVWIKDRINELRSVCQNKVKIITEISGESLLQLTYAHPIYGTICPVVSGSHVSDLKGTGLVHTAPSHGKEDFLVAIKEGLSTNLQLIDDCGYFKEEAGKNLAGKFVLNEGNEEVFNLIKFNTSPNSPIFLKVEKIKHSYPYDWRTKKPTIIRASQQWFFNIEKIKSKALEVLDGVTIYPETLRNTFVNSLKSRPYWCLSRQRVWGVPIPVFYDAETREPIINRDTIEHISKMVKSEGPDVWWKYESDKLLPPSYVEELARNGKLLPIKGNDIIDIWFDSGSSWYCALDGKQSDIYIEGYDQITGWFQSSLLISVAATGKAPFKKLIFHGFTVDENLQKMSKSLGNVFDPNVITHGGKSLSKAPVWGVNVLRWWAMNGVVFSDRRVGPKVLASCQSDVHSLLAVIWYLLAWLRDFNPADLLPYEELRMTDKYILHIVRPSLDKIWNAYELFETKEVCSNIFEFVSLNIGGNYLTAVKDILTCLKKEDYQRRCVQTTLFHLFPYVIYPIAPILPMVAEEAAMYYPVKGWSAYKHEHINIEPATEWDRPDIASLFEKIKLVKLSFIEQVKADETRTNSMKVLIKCSDDFHEALRKLQPTDRDNHSELCDFLSVSEVILELCSDLSSFSIKITDSIGTQCLRCRKYTICDGNEICARCKIIIS